MSKGTKSTRVVLADVGKEHKCPYCGYYNNSKDSLRQCGGCRSKWWKTEGGNYYYEKSVSRQRRAD